MTHFAAFASCFPGGSITGAPKIRAMEIIDELEPVTRGPYTGCLGYLGFNRESQLSILIRTAVCKAGRTYFHAGAGIVADSIPSAEYDETMAKAGGFLAALQSAADRFPLSLGRGIRGEDTSYFSLPSVSLIALKFGSSFGVGVCSLYWTTPSLSITNAARALTEPSPSRSGSNVP